MSTGSRRVFARMAAIVNKRLSNCEVEIAHSVGWVGQVSHEPVAPLVLDATKNITYTGIFSAYYEDALDAEGYQLSVSIPSVVVKPTAQFNALIRHGTRLAIRMQDYPELPRLICRVRNSQPDGRYRALHMLSALGPECAEGDALPIGFPYTFPVVLGGITSTSCYQLDGAGPRI